MWQTPAKTVAPGKRGRKRYQIHIKRTPAELKILGPEGAPPIVIQARALMNDLSDRGLGMFSAQLLHPGQEVELTILEPIKITVKARVAWCHEHQVGSHIMSGTPFTHRLGLEFIFQSPEEEKKMRETCYLLERTGVYTSRAPAVAAA